MLCNMMNGKCLHCGERQGGKCRLSSPIEPVVDMTTKLLGALGISQDKREDIVSHFGEAPNCACQQRVDWANEVVQAYGVKNIQKTTQTDAQTTQPIKRDEMHNQPQKSNNQQAKLDQVVHELEKEGVNLNNYTKQSKGLGDIIGNVFSKLGITEETVEAWGGIEGCGCQKRKKFLNQIIPFRTKA